MPTTATTKTLKALSQGRRRPIDQIDANLLGNCLSDSDSEIKTFIMTDIESVSVSSSRHSVCARSLRSALRSSSKHATQPHAFADHEAAVVTPTLTLSLSQHGRPRVNSEELCQESKLPLAPSPRTRCSHQALFMDKDVEAETNLASSPARLPLVEKRPQAARNLDSGFERTLTYASLPLVANDTQASATSESEEDTTSEEEEENDTQTCPERVRPATPQFLHAPPQSLNAFFRLKAVQVVEPDMSTNDGKARRPSAPDPLRFGSVHALPDFNLAASRLSGVKHGRSGPPSLSMTQPMSDSRHVRSTCPDAHHLPDHESQVPTVVGSTGALLKWKQNQSRLSKENVDNIKDEPPKTSAPPTSSPEAEKECEPLLSTLPVSPTGTMDETKQHISLPVGRCKRPKSLRATLYVSQEPVGELVDDGFPPSTRPPFAPPERDSPAHKVVYPEATNYLYGRHSL